MITLTRALFENVLNIFRLLFLRMVFEHQTKHVLMFSDGFRVPELNRKLRETCENNSTGFSSKSELMMPSYDKNTEDGQTDRQAGRQVGRYVW